jgi:uncharacterized protein (DUF2147 family)
MKGFWTLIVCTIPLLAIAALGQGGGADAVLGNWLTEEDRAIVEIYRCDDRYCGRIVWLKEPKNAEGMDKQDTENPDPTKRKRKILGLDMVWGFEYEGDNKWVGGKIYDPDTGKSYSCKMSLEGGALKVRGYVGISLIGRTTVWTRKK